MVVLDGFIMFCFNLSSIVLFWQAVFMIVISSSVGIFVCMFEISNEGSFSF